MTGRAIREGLHDDVPPSSTSIDMAPRAVSGRHLPALDGLRALAILGVIAYHLNLGWMSGGYLGVDLFFVLSGFLITSLLIEERLGSGRILLGAFWGRRARRLLPALFLVLAAVSVYAVINGRFSSPASGGAAIDLSGLRGDALATLFYVANWHAIFSHQSYFTQFATPSPLQHTWSLAIEEQFYLVWPLVTVGLLRWAQHRWRVAGATLCVVGAAASAVAMAVLYQPGADPSRIYYGTDTRAFDLLAGALVAFMVAGRPQPGKTAQKALHVGAATAAVVLAVFWVRGGTTSGLPTPAMFSGEFLLCAGLAAVVVADVRQLQQGVFAKALSMAPLRFIGRISYGLYLWHWPIFVYCNETRTGLSGASLDVVRVVLAFAVATLSFFFVEQPIRRHRFAGLRGTVILPGAIAVTALVVVIGTVPSFAEPIRPWAGGGLDPGSGPSVPGAGGYGGQVPITLPKGLVVDHEHPLRVVTFGDSIMSYAELGIRSALERTGDVRVFSAAVPGWRLSPGAHGTEAGLAGLFRGLRPELIIGTWSWDAAAAVANPARYQRVLDSAISQWLAPNTGVTGILLLQMPPLGKSADARARAHGVHAWNAAIRQAARTFPGRVMYLPVATSLELDGRYTNWLPPIGEKSPPLKRWVRIRTSDGVHLCPPGITRYAAPVLQDVDEIFQLPPANGKWWISPLITVRALASENSSLAVTCPDDHPPT